MFSRSSYHGSGNTWPTRTSWSDERADRAGSGQGEPWRKLVQDSTSGSRCQSVWQLSSFIADSICWWVYIHCSIAHFEQVQWHQGKDQFTIDETEPFHQSYDFLHNQEYQRGALHLHAQWQGEDSCFSQFKNTLFDIHSSDVLGRIGLSIYLQQRWFLPQRVMVSAVKSSVQLSTKQLIELLFSSQAIGHCKTVPTLQHGFLVQVNQKNYILLEKDTKYKTSACVEKLW